MIQDASNINIDVSPNQNSILTSSIRD